MAGVMVAAIVILADAFLRSVFYGGMGRRRSSRGKGGGQAQIVMIVLALVLAILAPLLAQILYFACSRRREYLADASAARFTRYPAGLAGALEKIAGAAAGAKMKNVSRAVAPMFIINPLRASGRSGLFSTHPPTEDRVHILRSMAGGAGYAEYEAAYERAHGGRGVLGEATLGSADAAAVRAPAAEPEKGDLERAREAVDILHLTAGYLMLQCACGLKVKIPPGYRKNEIKCPRCGRIHPVPTAVVAGATAALEGLADEEKGRRQAAPAESPRAAFTHTSGRWSSFRCPCGGTVQLSPNFSAPEVRCRRCGRMIDVKIV